MGRVPNEDTWEKLESLNQDVPARLREILNAASSDPLALAAFGENLTDLTFAKPNQSLNKSNLHFANGATYV